MPGALPANRISAFTPPIVNATGSSGCGYGAAAGFPTPIPSTTGFLGMNQDQTQSLGSALAQLAQPQGSPFPFKIPQMNLAYPDNPQMRAARIAAAKGVATTGGVGGI